MDHFRSDSTLEKSKDDSWVLNGQWKIKIKYELARIENKYDQEIKAICERECKYFFLVWYPYLPHLNTITCMKYQIKFIYIYILVVQYFKIFSFL